MELGLSLGETTSKPSFGFMKKATLVPKKANLGFCMALSISAKPDSRDEDEDDDEDTEEEDRSNHLRGKRIKKESLGYDHNPSRDSPLIQLDLLPNTPVPRHNQLCPSSHYEAANYMTKGLDVNRAEKGAAVSCSPPTSSASSFQMDLGKSGNLEAERASDEDENGCTRKKLRLSKQQSAFLEESFKEHTTLNPKQKLALAKQLNLRPRQVEVWFQNRRARTKLKQTEVDCEYLKRCCETLTEENRRLQKEVEELRALKTSNPMYMQLPPTTLTMCPSCERVTTTSTTITTTAASTATQQATDLSLSTRPRFQPLFNQPRIS